MFKLRNRPSAPARTLMSPINDFLRGYKENGDALPAHPFKGHHDRTATPYPACSRFSARVSRRRRSRMRRTRASRR
jgi:hypothetical protein